MIHASILGGSGYTGGELLRLLTAHPQIEVRQVTSRQHLGEYVYQVHPNLRKQTDLKFSDPETVEPSDLLFLALPHGKSQQAIEDYAQGAAYIIDLSADFRLRSAGQYERWYGAPHAAPEWLSRFVYGLPELHRKEIQDARYASGVGCNATASILALLPLVRANLLDRTKQVIVEIKVGSSESGSEGNPGSHHPERSGVIRTFSPFGHRHTAEVIQETGIANVSLTMTSVDLVRGALATAHGTVKPGVSVRDLWKAYREESRERLINAYDAEIRFTDDVVGDLLGELGRVGLRDDSWVVLTSDHGEGFWEHGLAEHGNSLYDELLRVPLVLVPPRAAGVPSRRVATAVSLVDLHATVLEMAGVARAENDGVEGSSLLDHVRGWKPSWAQRSTDDVSSQQPHSGDVRGAALLRWPWKLVRRTERKRPPLQLYDLATDPDERTNRAAAEPEIARRLDAALGRHLARDRAMLRAARAEAETHDLDAESIERLKALGYLD